MTAANALPAERSNVARFALCVLLFLIAATLRVLYAHTVLAQFAQLAPQDQTSFEMGYLTLDTPRYLEIATSLMQGHWADAVSLIRPIGYPAFMAVLSENPTAMLDVQAIALSLIPVCAFLLVVLFTGKNWLAFAAGLVSCLSPTGIALGSLLMSDGLFAVLFAVLFTAMAYGGLRNAPGWILFSAIMAGIAALVRPILLFWPVAAIVIAALIGGSSDPWRASLWRWLGSSLARWRQMLILFAVPAFFMLSWAEANYANNGIFTVSITGEMTLREYLAAKVEEWAFAGKHPPNDAVRRNQEEVRRHVGTLTSKDEVQSLGTESMAIFKKYPKQTVGAFLDNMLENSTVGWDYFPRQIPFSQNSAPELFAAISQTESRLRMLGVVVVLFAPVVGLVAAKFVASPKIDRYPPILLAMTLTFLYFAAMSGTTFWTGPRIVYPAEILAITSAATLLAMLVDLAGGRQAYREQRG